MKNLGIQLGNTYTGLQRPSFSVLIQKITKKARTQVRQGQTGSSFMTLGSKELSIRVLRAPDNEKNKPYNAYFSSYCLSVHLNKPALIAVKWKLTKYGTC